MRILFVEDDPLNRKVVKDMLQIAGAELVEAENAEIGLDLVGGESFDLVLMDLRMPGMDGLTAIRQLRARGDAKAQLPVIVVTADTALDLRERCIAQGADEVLLKPVAMGKLLKAMSQMLAKAAGSNAVVLS